VDPESGSVSGLNIRTPDSDQIRLGGGLRCPSALDQLLFFSLYEVH